MGNILISTTDLLPGYEITKHVDVVTEHTFSFLSEAMPSLTAMLNDASQTYKRLMEELYKELIAAMTQKATALHTNALIGFRLDVDWNHPNYFMFTGTATAVVAQSKGKKPVVADENAVGGETIKKAIAIKHLSEEIQECKECLIKNKCMGGEPESTTSSASMSVPMSVRIYTQTATQTAEKSFISFNVNNVMEKAVKTAIEQNAYKLCPELLTVLIMAMALSSESWLQKSAVSALSLLEYLPSENIYKTFLGSMHEATHYFPDGVEENVLRSSGNNFVQQFITKICPVSYGLIAEAVDTLPVYYWPELVIPLIHKYKGAYTESDIAEIEQLIDKMKFLMENLKFKRPAVPGLNGKDGWLCYCGNWNTAKDAKCKTCSRDIYGINQNLVDAVFKAITHLSELKAELENQFSN